MRGPRHKRYLLLTSEAPIDEEARRELTRRIAKISAVFAKKAVWFERAVIVKTDNVDLPLVRNALEVSAGGVTLKATLTSGAIGKLKKPSRGSWSRMVKYFSPEFFSQLQDSLATDAKWQEATKALKTTVKLTSTGQGNASTYLLKVEDGKTSISPSEAAAQAEFSFEGAYETWTKVAKGEVDFQSAVLKGVLRFKGSITKILVYKDKFLRIAEVMRSIAVEF